MQWSCAGGAANRTKATRRPAYEARYESTVDASDESPPQGAACVYTLVRRALAMCAAGLRSDDKLRSAFSHYLLLILPVRWVRVVPRPARSP
ncbi:hypothetical protein GCM10023175_56120 [Pseudonocardia xishanensis]|uniref:Uncharacterized protein n=1 Tax=Pseudonocardia xishanensis TaxID=630995 RepID=A0ABP8S185_9PSEU